MVITAQGQHPTALRGALDIGLAEHICTAVHPVALAIPDRKHPIAGGLLAIVIEQLGPPDIGGPQVFVDTGLKVDIPPGEQFLWRHSAWS